MRKVKIGDLDYWENGEGVLIPNAMYIRQGARVRTPTDVLGMLTDERVAAQEHFVVFTLDGGHKIIKKHVVTIGLVNSSQIHPREVFHRAVMDNAVGIIVAHNHPSGMLEASVDDLLATRRLAEAAGIMGIPLLDHLIVSVEGHVSLREKFPDYFTARRPA